MSTQYPFPSIAQSEKAKNNKDYYKQWAQAIVCNTFTNGWCTDYNKKKLLYDFFLEGTSSNLTGYLQTAPDGSALPGIWTSVSNVKSRIKVLLGELEERGYVIKARALNSEAVARKYEERERLRIERIIQPTLEFGQEESGLDASTGEYIPQTDQELDEYMDLTWKDKHVLILEAALKWIAHRSHWDEKRKRLFLDVLIANIMIIRNEIVRGVPQPAAVDPMKFIFDPNATDDMLSDSTYFGEADYMPLAQAAERYGLSLKEMEEAQKEYQTYLGMGLDARNSPADNSFGCMPGQSLKWFKTEDGIPRCLVVRAVWRDIKILSHKNEKNEKYDSEHLQDVTGKDVKKKDEDKIIHNKLECWRQGTIIGGKFLREWGECPNQARELNSLEVSEPPYKVWIPEYFLGKSVSLVEQQVGLALLKDVAVFQLQVQMARAVGKVIVIDEAYLPANMTKEQAMGYMKADGVVWVNSFEYQNKVPGGAAANLFKDYDLGLSQTITQGIQLIQYFDQQLDQVSGINSERQGQVQGASTAVGVQQSAVLQSNLITAPYFKGFERTCSRVMNHLAKMVKMAWGEGKEMFAPIIGDVGVDFLKSNIDISLEEFDVIVQSLPPQLQERQKFESLIMVAVQTGELPVSDALSLLLEPDLTVSVRKFQRKFALRQAKINQQEQMQAQMDQMLQARQIEQQAAAQEGNMQLQRDLQGMKGDNNLKKTIITSRTKLQGQKLDLLSR